MRSVTLLVLALVLPPTGAFGQRTTQISEDLMAALGAIADTATVEHLRCGFYDEVGDTVLVLSRIVAPVVVHSDSASMAVARCPPGTDLVWHNHRVLDPDHRPEWYCMLSPADVALVLRSPPRLYMIAVSSKVRCWWTSAQVLAVLEGHVWPVPGQFYVAKP